MSVIENPVAYLNETQATEYDDATTLIKKDAEAAPSSQRDLDETPLTSDKNKPKSPKKLNQSASEDKTELCNISLSSQTEVSQKEKVSGETEPRKVVEAAESMEKTVNDSAEVRNNILAVADELPDSESDDEEYVPGAEPIEDGHAEEEQEEEIKRTYRLRDGLKGAVEEKNKEVEHEDSDKKKADDLWSAFKADVALPVKRKAKELETVIREKTYDFAGEAVTVCEEVKNNTKEEVKNKRKSIATAFGFDRKRRRESAPLMKESSSDASSSALVETDGLESTDQHPVKRTRPISKLNSIVNRLSKKPKMSVMTKTALDWETYKKQKDIEDDVKNEAKADGYVEKQDFLNRSDHRQYELEKEIRLQQQRRRQMMNSKQF